MAGWIYIRHLGLCLVHCTRLVGPAVLGIGIGVFITTVRTNRRASGEDFGLWPALPLLR